VANGLNAKYPADADATLLTGYAFFFPLEFTGAFIQSWFAPADLSDPRYAGLSPGYLELNNQNYLSFLFYDPGQFSQSLQDVDFNNRGTISLGEAAGTLVGSLQTIRARVASCVRLQLCIHMLAVSRSCSQMRAIVGSCKIMRRSHLALRMIGWLLRDFEATSEAEML
jgi:hypothetical protein